MKKPLKDIDRALTVQRATDVRPRPDKNADTTFGIFQKQDGQLGMGNKVVRLDDSVQMQRPCWNMMIQSINSHLVF